MSDPLQPVRLSKLMAERGLCSRREADAFISRGWVEVDGHVVDQLGTKVLPTQQVRLLPRARHAQAGLVTILLNKPVGYVSGQPEKGYPPAVSLITSEHRLAGDAGAFDPRRHLAGLAPAGRLDIDSRGLLVFTQDGRLARRLTSAEALVEKEYLVGIRGTCTPETLRTLQEGSLTLDGRPLKPCVVEQVEPERLRFVLREGRHRQIRRMCAAVNLEVRSLLRVRIGNVRLGRLPVGQWRLLAAEEAF